ncbi:hypothetical protein [Bacillus alkalicellulosilyticus]|uniref:hypothetical protein n=1 Tax=Alkalihalobacterium alkalicellulosilyticum TaxID=1912214 RepID=UPI000998C78A|nr:hypothetical protein [Bacillus alkalicellulosilyticus]
MNHDGQSNQATEQAQKFIQLAQQNIHQAEQKGNSLNIEVGLQQLHHAMHQLQNAQGNDPSKQHLYKEVQQHLQNANEKLHQIQQL